MVSAGSMEVSAVFIKNMNFFFNSHRYSASEHDTARIERGSNELSGTAHSLGTRWKTLETQRKFRPTNGLVLISTSQEDAPDYVSVQVFYETECANCHGKYNQMVR